MHMTKDEILSRCLWDKHDSATLTVYSPMFAREVDICFYPHFDAGRQLNGRMVAALNHFLNLSGSDLETVMELLWVDCQRAFDAISYGVDILPGESETEANHRDFNIHTRDDAYAKSHFRRISIPGDPALKNDYAAIEFEPEWDPEHGCSVVMKNGQLIDTYSNDVPFGRYDDGRLPLRARD
jgi:hypothetical protein